MALPEPCPLLVCLPTHHLPPLFPQVFSELFLCVQCGAHRTRFRSVWVGGHNDDRGKSHPLPHGGRDFGEKKFPPNFAFLLWKMGTTVTLLMNSHLKVAG